MAKLGFVFRFEWAEILSEYPAELRLAVYDAIIRYAETGEVDSLDDGAARMAFSFIRNDVNYDSEKYQAECERRSTAGKRNIARRWDKNTNGINGIPADTKNSYRDRDRDRDSECDSESDRKKNVANATLKESAAVAALSTADADDAVSSAERPNVDEREFIDAWNSARAKNNAIVPPVQTIKGRRLAMLKARIKDYGEQRVVEVFGRAAASGFLNGGGSQGFVANIDWVLRPNNFVKVMEGNYDSRRATAGSGYNVGTTQIDNSTDKWEGEEEKWK